MRVGHGFDSHRLVLGRKLILGGVIIPFDKGFAAHSDGDVVIHALCDALLGAATLGDIGRHFPDSNADFKDISSRILLQRVAELIRDKGYAIENIDITVLADSPKITPHVEAITRNLATDLVLSPTDINVKATTTDGMGFVGRGEGIAVHSVVLLT